MFYTNNIFLFGPSDEYYEDFKSKLSCFPPIVPLRRETYSTASLAVFWWGKLTSWAGPTPAPSGESCWWAGTRWWVRTSRPSLNTWLLSLGAEGVGPAWWLLMTSSSRSLWRLALCCCCRPRSESVADGWRCREMNKLEHLAASVMTTEH